MITTHRPIEDIEADLLLAALHQRYGYDFSGYARASLLRRLRQMVDYFGVDCISRLTPTLLHDERVAQAIVNYISVPVSEFFRDPEVWKYLREAIAPQLESFPRINVWQIGCGYGQETYSVAMLLKECGLAHKARMITSDINADLLDTARRARWPLERLAAWRANYRAAGGSAHFDDYFKHEGDEIVLRTALLPPVEFVLHNLVTDDVFMETQLIVCRNVLIYFGMPLQTRALDLFSRSLERGGFLLLGCAENIASDDASWTAAQPELRIFRKRSGANISCIV